MVRKDYIRQIGHLPERTSDTRETERTRQEQQEQSQPPEPEIAAENSRNSDDGEVPDNVVEAAKRRLGRSSADGNKVHTTRENP